MTDTQQPDWSEFARQITEQVRPFAAVFAERMREFWESPSGQYLKAVVDYYDRHPEELEAAIAAREAEARVRYCDCMCGRWDHRGSCTMRAETERRFSLYGDPVDVPLCGPCADSIDSQRPLVSTR